MNIYAHCRRNGASRRAGCRCGGRHCHSHRAYQLVSLRGTNIVIPFVFLSLSCMLYIMCCCQQRQLKVGVSSKSLCNIRILSVGSWLGTTLSHDHEHTYRDRCLCHTHTRGDVQRTRIPLHFGGHASTTVTEFPAYEFLVFNVNTCMRSIAVSWSAFITTIIRVKGECGPSHVRCGVDSACARDAGVRQ
jgi:hypothetical protein